MTPHGVEENRAALDELSDAFLIVVGPEDACLQGLLHVAAADHVGSGLPRRIARLTHQICQQTKLAHQLLLITYGAHAVLEDGFDAAVVKVAQPFLTTQTSNKVGIAGL